MHNQGVQKSNGFPLPKTPKLIWPHIVLALDLEVPTRSAVPSENASANSWLRSDSFLRHQQMTPRRETYWMVDISITPRTATGTIARTRGPDSLG